MKIVSCDKIDLSTIAPGSSCSVYVIHLQINNVKERAGEMITAISSTSWIKKLSAVDAASFAARAKRTIEKLAQDVFMHVSSSITDEFGEYMVSMSAQETLESSLDHRHIPLAELFKEKLTGNPGFDFHSESPNEFLTFGEAKYSGSENPYNRALSQINEFVDIEKDTMELTDLSKLASPKAIENAINGKRAYAAAFSLNAQNTSRIFKNALASEHFQSLLHCAELFLIGVEVIDTPDNDQQ